MTRTTRFTAALAAAVLTATAGVRAQERIGSSAPLPQYRAGWTLTPTFGVAETYDDNISLFGRGSAEQQNNDYIATIFPGADLHYVGKHTQFGSSYSGSFLDYRTFTSLNRWDQHARVELRREETAHFKWFAHANAAMIPSTDLIELGGIPFRHTGAKTSNARGGIDYAFGAKDGISTSLDYQSISFDRTPEVASVLRGGHVTESLTAWRHRLESRLAVGADYTFRQASVVGDTAIFNLHSTQAALDYELSPLWSLSAAGGIVYMQSTPTIAGRTGPALRVAIQRHRAGTTFHAGYLRSYIPSFGFGGTIQNQEVSVGFRTPIFGWRHVYVDNTAVFRDDQPLTNTLEQLPLRSLRTYSILGWEPENWVRIEGFYARVQQSSLRAGGQLFRNRVGIQIVTSKPMRMH
jgi:hypothetical protein